MNDLPTSEVYSIAKKKKRNNINKKRLKIKAKPSNLYTKTNKII